MAGNPIQLLKRAALTLAVLGLGCLLGIAFFTIADVVGRYAFGQPIEGLYDISSLATAVIISSLFPILLLRRGNITLRPFASTRRPQLTRILDAFGSLVTAAFFSLMAWQYVLFSAEAAKAGVYMPVLRWPVGPWWWTVTGLMVVSAATAIAVFAMDAAGQPAEDD